MTGDSSAPSGTSPPTHNSFATGFLSFSQPCPSTACDELIPELLLDNNQPNPAYISWVREDQLVLSWIVASVFEGILPQLVGAETARKAWTKLTIKRDEGRLHIARIKDSLSQNPASYQYLQTSICHNCESKGHVARDSPSPKTPNGTRISDRPNSNLASTQSSPTQNWLMDSGTTHHLTSDLDNLAIHSGYQSPEEVTLGNGSRLTISHIGKCFIAASDKKIKLDNTLHIPTSTQNLNSISSFAKSNNFSDLVTRGILHTGPSRDGLYSLPVTKLLSLAFFVASLGVWHARLAHAFYPTVRRALPTAVLASSKSSSLYTTCVVSKSHIVLFSESTFKASTPPDLICSDVWGPVSDAQVPRSSTNSIREPITLQLPMFHSQPTPHASSETDVITSL
ncbi:hypothetical protein H5410_014456 [Solanum commersonii]|uniref:Retrovirus-related Pol polyprotein from transposon TNT 1-94-like beta-barrel domain-containing protein n=1 Tax=Solanum commersonii TaxID=4109 RepID=A0A9J5ZR23_SOLCO|nr:hypothetical protein H5410_014456 [Solanum commersonii]